MAEAKPKKKVTRKRRKRPESPIGLGPGELMGTFPPGVDALCAKVARDGAVLACYREPLGGHWVVLVSLPVEMVEPTPYQREASKTHVEKIARVMEKVGRFLDPIILSPSPDGRYWTPNGNHRLQALKKLNARTVLGILVPEEEISHQILALNTEKAYNLREKARGVLKLVSCLAAGGGSVAARTEESLAFELEDPALVTLGLAYEARPRFSGGAYHPLLKRIEGFLDLPLAKALSVRKARSERLLEIDDVVGGIMDQLKKRGFTSPFLRPFVVARINPIRFHQGDPPDFDQTLEKMLRSGQRFDAGKVKETDIARTGGPPPAPEE